MNYQSELEPETWVERHGDSLYRYAILRVRDPEAASDLVQEAFLEALRARASFAGRSSARTWLIAILKHKIVDRRRKLGRDQRLRASGDTEGGEAGMFDRRGRWRTPPSAWEGDPLREYERREFWEVLGTCLSNMPPRLADVFLGLELEGMSRGAICRDEGISPENLSVRLYRARLLLRHCLEIHWFQGRTARSESRASHAWAMPPGRVPERI